MKVVGIIDIMITIMVTTVTTTTMINWLKMYFTSRYDYNDGYDENNDNGYDDH